MFEKKGFEVRRRSGISEGVLGTASDTPYKCFRVDPLVMPKKSKAIRAFLTSWDDWRNRRTVFRPTSWPREIFGTPLDGELRFYLYANSYDKPPLSDSEAAHIISLWPSPVPEEVADLEISE
ncbi:MAG: hypothetical protein D6679_01880 [Candidatus Hydrogenedentota bacterium]|nr:MAG: hypothetical protein D6679_01880 [Candidatus Hydrogenedentota bacterium]